MKKEPEQKKKMRTYAPEFKANLLELALTGDRSPLQLAKDFEVPARTLYGWMHDSGWRGTSGRRPAAQKPIEDKDRELLALRARCAELERKNRDLAEDREILKKATAFFAKNQP